MAKRSPLEDPRQTDAHGVAVALKAKGLQVTRSSDGGWRAQCPAHGGKNPTSLSIRQHGGKLLLHCHSNRCEYGAILDALDLKAPRADGQPGGTRRRTWTYNNLAGETVKAVRIDLGPDDKDVYREPAGVRGPYVPLTMKANGDGPVVIVEGETCAEAVQAVGFTAVCWIGGTGSVGQTAWHQFAFGSGDSVEIVIWPDHDAAGRKCMSVLVAVLQDHPDAARHTLKAVRVPDGKDEGWDAANAGADEARRLVAEASEDALADLIDSAESAGDATVPAADPKKKLTELEAARVLHAHMAGRWCFDSRKKVWRRLRYGRVWMEDGEGAMREAGEIIGAYRGSRGMHRRHSLANALVLTAVERHMYALKWDTGKDLCCPGGIIDCQTGTWHPSVKDPAARHTRLTAVDPDMDADAPAWDAFLRAATGDDDALMRDLQRFAGYTLTAETREEQFYVLVGPPGTGKTTFISIIEYLLGDYARTVSVERLTGRQQTHRQWMAGLDGMRLVISSEPPPTNAAWRSGELSSFVSGETQEANFMRANSFNFKPVAKLWICANDIPSTGGPNTGILRRIVPVPFEVQVPDDKKDRGLFGKLMVEAPAILAWAVRGLAEYRQHGSMGILSQSVLDRRQEYATEQDSVAKWIAESDAVEETPMGEISKADTYQMYVQWCNDEGIKPLASRTFNKRVRQRNDIGESIPWIDGKRVRAWTGLAAMRTPTKAEEDAVYPNPPDIP